MNKEKNKNFVLKIVCYSEKVAETAAAAAEGVAATTTAFILQATKFNRTGAPSEQIEHKESQQQEIQKQQLQNPTYKTSYTQQIQQLYLLLTLAELTEFLKQQTVVYIALTVLQAIVQKITETTTTLHAKGQLIRGKRKKSAFLHISHILPTAFFTINLTHAHMVKCLNNI